MCDEMRGAIEAQAEGVASWLRDLFAGRSFWLGRELFLAAEREGIDLATWSLHPAVREVMERHELRPPWHPSVGIVVYTAKPLEVACEPLGVLRDFHNSLVDPDAVVS